jgi:hypothetical protein
LNATNRSDVEKLGFGRLGIGLIDELDEMEPRSEARREFSL